MKSLLITSTLLFTFLSSSFSQDTTLKRIPYKLKVAVDKDVVYEEDIKATAYVLPNKTIQLYPGENVYIEVEQENGMVKSMTAVKEIKIPAKTLTITFTQTTKKKVHEGIILKIENPFPFKIIYKAKIYLLQQKKWVDTNVLPVEPKLSGYETWSDIITSIALGNWTFETK